MDSKQKYLLYGSEHDELFLEGDFGNHLSSKYYIEVNKYSDFKENIYLHLELENKETNEYTITEFSIPDDSLEIFRNFSTKDKTKYDWIKYVDETITEGGKITLDKYNCPTIFLENIHSSFCKDYKWILLPFSIIDQIQDILYDDSKDESIIIDKKLIDSSIVSGHYRLLNSKYKKIIKVYKAFNVFLDNIGDILNEQYFPESDLSSIEHFPNRYLPKPDDY
jgi:hypothetical protein